MKRFVLVLAVVTFALTVAADEYTDLSSISPISRFFCCFVTLNTMIFTNRTYFPANSLWVRGIFVSLRQLL